MTRAKTYPVLPLDVVKRAMDREMAEREWSDDMLYTLMSERFGGRPDGYFRQLLRARQRGGWIKLHEADRFLVVLGLTLYDLDGYTWDYEPPVAKNRSGQKTPEHVVEQGLQMIAEGREPWEVAKALDVDYRTVTRWRHRAGVAA